MLSGLRFERPASPKVEKRSKKKDRRKEQKKHKKRKDNKAKRGGKGESAKAKPFSDSSAESSEAAATGSEVSDVRAIVDVAKPPPVVQQSAVDSKNTSVAEGLLNACTGSAPTGDASGGDFFSSLGVERAPNGGRPDPERVVVHERELNPFLQGESPSQPAPKSVNKVPEGLCVGDRGAAWRQRALRRARQSTDAANHKVTTAPAQRSRSRRRSLSRSRRCSQIHNHHRGGDSTRDPKLDGRRLDGTGRTAELRRSRSPCDRQSSAGCRGRGANAATDWRMRDGGLLEQGVGEDATGNDAEVVLQRMRSKYGGESIIEPNPVAEATQPLSQQLVETADEEPEDANALGALAMQAMLSGDMVRYEQLNSRLEKKQAELTAGQTSGNSVGTGGPAGQRVPAVKIDPCVERTEVIEEVDAAGRDRTLLESVQSSSIATRGKHRGTARVGRTKDKKGKEDGFYEDDDISLDDLIRRERIAGVQDYDDNIAQHIAGNAKYKPLHEDDDEAYALGWYENASKKTEAKRLAQKREQHEVRDKKCVQRNLHKCVGCMDSRRFNHDLVISFSPHAYVHVQSFGQCILPGQMAISPQEHLPATTDLDEGTWTEMRNYQKCIVRFFEAESPPRAVIFAESSVHRVSKESLLLGCGPHACVVAYPVPLPVLSEARAYFKKALDEAECEWAAQHKKVIPTTAKGGVRAAVPKNFPFVHIDFSLCGGYAHVVEEEYEFPGDFVQQTIAGMCELTKLDRAYATRDEHRAAAQDLKQRFGCGFDWTRALSG